MKLNDEVIYTMKTLGNVIIDVQPWSLAPGYPIGDTSL
mgnify:CR=1 FL=1